MIRRVAYVKAVIGGAFGALVWEVVARSLIFSGVSVFDIVRALGTMAAGEGASFLEWWTIGLSLHCVVGAIWAVFYAYFFWSSFDLLPTLQGMLFSLLPATLAGLVMVPQLDTMRQVPPALGIFAHELGWAGPGMLIIGHLVYGAVVGSIYVRPVGYRVGKKVKFNA
jgi:hypothetical protein